ncbi:MAG: PaaI family thioesterase [Verrucomicrobiota bacterium]|jgi:acyl-CoA thioesterase|nr:PaaI family thioesterase [Verrucomicrobiota bacterium]HCF96988.1 phenylacetic acid degradation protein [Verrucomicrobiota bacterium]
MPDYKAVFNQHDLFARRNGMAITECGPGWAKAEMTVQPHHLNGAGTLHGGAMYTLADFAFACACNTHGDLAVAIACTMNYHRAVQQGVVRVQIREVARTKRIGTYAAELTDENDTLVASFTGTAYARPGVPLPSLAPPQ